MNRPIKLLLAAGTGSGLPEVITEHVQATLRPNETLTVQEVDTVTDLRLAEAGGHDLAVLILNNILASGGDQSFAVRLEQVLDVVRELSDGGMPVISLCGFTDGLDVANLAKAAGARFYSPLPFKVSAFQGAVRECLSAEVHAAGAAGALLLPGQQDADAERHEAQENP